MGRLARKILLIKCYSEFREVYRICILHRMIVIIPRRRVWSLCKWASKSVVETKRPIQYLWQHRHDRLCLFPEIEVPRVFREWPHSMHHNSPWVRFNFHSWKHNNDQMNSPNLHQLPVPKIYRSLFLHCWWQYRDDQTRWLSIEMPLRIAHNRWHRNDKKGHDPFRTYG